MEVMGRGSEEVLEDHRCTISFDIGSFAHLRGKKGCKRLGIHHCSFGARGQEDAMSVMVYEFL